MPAASSSRTGKRNRRAPTSDIEEDGPSQARHRQGVEDVEMDEAERQPRRTKKTKKEKNREQVDSDGEALEEEQDNVPIPEISDQPLDKAHAQKVRGMASDWAVMRDKVHLPGYNLAGEVGASVAEFIEGEKGEKALLDIERIMRKLLDTEHELTTHERALNEIFQQLSRAEKIPNVMDVYEKSVTEKMEAYKTQTSRQKYAKNDHYYKFKQAIYEVQHDGAMPPLVDLIPKEDGDDSDDEDDLQIGGVTQNYKCPLSLTYLVDPLTSKLCGHSYSKGAIQDYLGGRGSKKDCPSTGCRKVIGMSDLQADVDLAKRAKQAERRELAREEDSADEEVID